MGRVKEQATPFSPPQNRSTPPQPLPKVTLNSEVERAFTNADEVHGQLAELEQRVGELIGFPPNDSGEAGVTPGPQSTFERVSFLANSLGAISFRLNVINKRLAESL